MLEEKITVLDVTGVNGNPMEAASKILVALVTEVATTGPRYQNDFKRAGEVPILNSRRNILPIGDFGSE
jgi:hypothetical protein